MSLNLLSLPFPPLILLTLEIKELREKVLYWKRASEIHHLEGFHIMAELYSEYMKKAQKELERAFRD